MTRHTVRIEDEDLSGFVDEAENKSELFRDALQLYRLQHEGVDDDRLTDTQRTAYQWLREYVDGTGCIQMEKAVPMLAQIVSLNKDVVKYFVIGRLDHYGYIEVEQRMQSVALVVQPPDAAREPSQQLQVDEVEDVGERMDALTEAGEEAAES